MFETITKIDLCDFYAGDYCRCNDNEEGLCWHGSDYRTCKYYLSSKQKENIRKDGGA